MSDPLVSIVINNYNYARFIRGAIDSALDQDYPRVEVVVVDDGSTDGSRDIILSYGDRIKAVIKPNGGQASAFNAGVVASSGTILCFLDSDDFFSTDKVSRVVETFRVHGLDATPMMVHHLLSIKDDGNQGIEGRPYGRTHNSPMNLYAFAQRHRFVWYEAGPTTTISINRSLANLLFPIPEEGVRVSADDFVVCGAFLLGDVYSLADVLGSYRVHGGNNWFHSDHKKSGVFLLGLQNYLNAKLIESGRLPVIDYDNSIYAWHRLRAERRWLALLAHMLRLSIRDHDRYTALFVYHTLMTIGMQAKQSLQSRVGLKAAPGS